MIKRLPILFLPLTILSFLVMLIYSTFISEQPISFTVFVVIMVLVVIFSAYQSLYIQTTLILFDPDDTTPDEKDYLSKAIALDFLVYFLLYSVMVSLIYWFIVWLIWW